MTKGAAVTCYGCRHFRITYDKRFPYACDVFGFKGKALPCVTVLTTTGAPCDARVPLPDSPSPPPSRAGGKDGWLV